MHNFEIYFLTALTMPKFSIDYSLTIKYYDLIVTRNTIMGTNL